MVYSSSKDEDVLVRRKERKDKLKKFDKEYSTQYTPEKDYLQQNGIMPSFIKIVDDVITYKYTKTSKLFSLLAVYYRKYD